MKMMVAAVMNLVIIGLWIGWYSTEIPRWYRCWARYWNQNNPIWNRLIALNMKMFLLRHSQYKQALKVLYIFGLGDAFINRTFDTYDGILFIYMLAPN